MPSKRKDNAANSATTGPNRKRSKPSFRTPTTAGIQEAAPSQPSLSKNRVVTLRTSATGRRGYHTAQDIQSDSSPTLESLPSSSAPEACHPTDSSVPDANLTANPSLTPGSLPFSTNSANSNTNINAPDTTKTQKSRAKQTNTTTVR